MDYEKEYKAALERAKKIKDNPNASTIRKEWIEQIFPELAESEDERIRKAIIHYILYETNGTISEDLEKEYKVFVEDDPVFSKLCNRNVGLSIARHFAEWQKEQMMKGAVEGFIFQSEDYYPKELIARYNGGLKHGDKVRIIVLPKED